MRRSLTLLTIAFVIASCGQSNNKQKELELKERELALKQKELELKERENKSDSQPTVKTTVSQQEVIKETAQNATSLKVPITVGKVSNLLGKYTKFEPCELPCNLGSTYHWKLENGLNVEAYALEVGENSKPSNTHKLSKIDFSTNGSSIIDDCVFGLSLNKTTLSECKQHFGLKLKKSMYGGRTYKFFQDRMYFYFSFNSSNILTAISKASWEEDMSG
jgi:hypothetical protein